MKKDQKPNPAEKPDPQDLRRQLTAIRLPRWNELPEIGLYMDQVLAYLNGHLEPLNFGSDKPMLTASMINNYVKNSIVKAPTRKQYQRYHLAYLIVVAIMKKCYSLSEISRLIDIYSDISDSDRIAKDFNKFVCVLEDSLKEVLETGSCTHSFFDVPTGQQQLMVNVIRTVALKMYADCDLYAYDLKEERG